MHMDNNGQFIYLSRSISQKHLFCSSDTVQQNRDLQCEARNHEADCIRDAYVNTIVVRNNDINKCLVMRLANFESVSNRFVRINQHVSSAALIWTLDRKLPVSFNEIGALSFGFSALIILSKYWSYWWFCYPSHRSLHPLTGPLEGILDSRHVLAEYLWRPPVLVPRLDAWPLCLGSERTLDRNGYLRWRLCLQRGQ